MRLISGTVTVPTIGTGIAAKAAARHLELRKHDSSAALEFPEHWNEVDVRGALYAIQGRTCAYCSCELVRNDRGDVDHFRPKKSVWREPNHGGYWWLAYVFDNYLISCSKCNRTRKRDKFPLRAGSNRCTFDTASDIGAESRLLLHPRIEPVESWLLVDLDDKHLCRILPNPALDHQDREMVAKTLSIFRLNSDVRLVRERTDVRYKVQKLVEKRRFSDVRKLAIRFQPHSLVAKQILEKFAPEYLPTPDQEIRWLADETLRDIEVGTRLVECGEDQSMIEADLRECLWMLAVAIYLVGSDGAKSIKKRLSEADILDDVMSRHGDLSR
jgi:uncharacterized protein (TIGR02646 family)